MTLISMEIWPLVNQIELVILARRTHTPTCIIILYGLHLNSNIVLLQLIYFAYLIILIGHIKITWALCPILICDIGGCNLHAPHWDKSKCFTFYWFVR